MSLLRSCSGALATALADGTVQYVADLTTISLIDGSTVYRWTNWDQDLSANGHAFTASKPWIARGKWGLVNTMTVPELELSIIADNSAFLAGANLKAQAHGGLFDGASLLLQRAYMAGPGDTATLGTIDVFSGIVGPAQIIGTKVTLRVKGKNSRLDRPAPRRVYQGGCLNTFCDSACTLNRATFTHSLTVGSSPAPTRTFIPWTSAPLGYTVYAHGSVTMTSGASSGQKRTVVAVDSTGLTLAYPLIATPSAGDTYSALTGCDKTLAGAGAGGGNCTLYSNTVNFGGFPFIPSPPTAGRGSF